MTRALTHRGPDDEGFHVKDHVGLGHRRLSIIDLSGGHQPMANSDQSVWLIFNGEIYNYVELGEELKKQGIHFRTHSDTEVLLAAYEVYGTACVQKLRGMFAFAIWDSRKQWLFLARDRLGKKPLYFYQEGERFSFASEFTALLEDEGIPRRLNLTALDDYLTLGYIPAPHTILEGVSKLPPAHWAIFQRGKLLTQRYWNLSFKSKQSLSDSAAGEQFLEQFKEAVKLRLRADVPLGILLSGGMDSSAVTAVAAELSSRPLETFSIGFEEADFDELSYARLVSKRFSTRHHEFIVRPDTLKTLPRLIRHYGEPFGDSSALPTYVLAHMTRHYVTVALNGDGGDETLAGYTRYQALAFSERLGWVGSFQGRNLSRLCLHAGRWLPGQARTTALRMGRFFEALGRPEGARYARWVSLFTPEQKQRLWLKSIRREFQPDRAWEWVIGQMQSSDAPGLVERAMQTDLSSYLPGDPIVKMDIATMAHGLEVRSPFLDHKLMEFLATLPERLKLRGGRSKFILYKAMAKRLPPAILSRGKQGFGVPVGHWFKGISRDMLRQQLLDPEGPCRQYFSQGQIRDWLTEHLTGSQNHSHRLWALLIFSLWHRNFLQKIPEDKLLMSAAH